MNMKMNLILIMKILFPSEVGCHNPITARNSVDILNYHPILI